MKVIKRNKTRDGRSEINHSCKTFLSDKPKWDGSVSWEVNARIYEDSPESNWIDAYIFIRDCRDRVELDFSTKNSEAVFDKLNTLIGQLELFRDSYKELVEKVETGDRTEDTVSDVCIFKFNGDLYKEEINTNMEESACYLCAFSTLNGADNTDCMSVTPIWNCLEEEHSYAVKIGNNVKDKSS